MRRALIVATVAWLALNTGGLAELRFEQQRIVLDPPAGVDEVSGVFKFENTGAAPVRITEVRSDCGCTVALLEENLILPGKTGRIRASFDVGSKQGHNDVAIHVSTDEGRASPYLLNLEVNIRASVQVSPRSVYWRIGGQPEERLVSVLFEDGYKFVAAESSSPDFKVEVVGSGEHFAELRVSPRDLWAKRNGAIQLKFIRADGTPLEIPVQLRIM